MSVSNAGDLSSFASTIMLPFQPATVFHKVDVEINWITQEGQGTSGPIQASFQGTIQDPLSKAWTKTLREVGYCLTGDPFSGSATGGFSSPITVDPTSKTRSYAGSAYFLPANKTGSFCSGGIGSYAFMPMTDFATESGEEELRELFKKYPAENKDMERYNLLRTIFEDPKESTGSAFMFLAQTFTQNLDPHNFVSLGISLLHPLSRGSVHIASADATQPPIIDPKYLSNELDVEFMSRHLRFMETIAESQPLASFIKPGGKRNHEMAHVKDLEAAKDYVRTTTISNNHPACSCPMMPRDKGGVVDAQLLVYGTANLRIVDASVMPLIPRGNIQSSVYAVAERAADLIKEDHHIQK
ncbi:hypothetical protein VTN00DRAFT_3989 [Thermoascus crustaceus]|uniref:uncharacterized protein n=1 Tax=Thermoascus crustaceus TaxID=5088 RepID=UPI0037442B76